MFWNMKKHNLLLIHTYTKGILGTFIYKMNTLTTLSTFIDKSNMGPWE